MMRKRTYLAQTYPDYLASLVVNICRDPFDPATSRHSAEDMSAILPVNTRSPVYQASESEEWLEKERDIAIVDEVL